MNMEIKIETASENFKKQDSNGFCGMTDIVISIEAGSTHPTTIFACKVRGIAIVKKPNKHFITFPSKLSRFGNEIYYFHPINTETRKMITDVVFKSYENWLSERRAQTKIINRWDGR